MKTNELNKLESIQLIDVRLKADYEESHIAGAVSNCVFETDFVDRLTDSTPDKATQIVVYGANASTLEADAALEKLRRNGYTNIDKLEGGLDAAKADGLKLEHGEPVEHPAPLADGSHKIDLSESQLEWQGRNLINKHWGTVDLEAGSLEFKDEQLVGGSFTADLNKLKSKDLEGSDMHDALVGHLKSEDFFDVENHPKAHFKITSVKCGTADSLTSENLEITGDLTLRGQTHPITFNAATGVSPEGKAVAQAAFSIDRTRWGVLYGSGKFFARLAGHLVRDELEFQLKIVTA